MQTQQRFPSLRQVALDCLDPRALADFYRQLLGFEYRPGDEVVSPDGDDWLVIQDAEARTRVAFQQVSQLTATTWPEHDVPQQMHLDLTVPSVADLAEQHERVLALGGRLLFDRSDDDDEPLRVYADLAGHPFCIFVVG